nr:hypothetical protein [Rickettsia akari]
MTNDSIRAADDVLECLEQAFDKLAHNPNIGSEREDLTNNTCAFGLYIIIILFALLIPALYKFYVL